MPGASSDSLVSSLPSQGWSCQTLEDGVQAAAMAAGLTLKTQDYLQARTLVGFIEFIPANMCCSSIYIFFRHHFLPTPVYIYIYIYKTAPQQKHYDRIISVCHQHHVGDAIRDGSPEKKWNSSSLPAPTATCEPKRM